MSPSRRPDDRLRVRVLADTSARPATASSWRDRDVERPAWAPNGERLAFTTGGARPGVFITPTDGRYVEPRERAPRRAGLGARRAHDRAGGARRRSAGVQWRSRARRGSTMCPKISSATGRLWTVAVPTAPDDGLVERRVTADSVATGTERRGVRSSLDAIRRAVLRDTGSRVASPALDRAARSVPAAGALPRRPTPRSTTSSTPCCASGRHFARPRPGVPPCRARIRSPRPRGSRSCARAATSSTPRSPSRSR